MEPKTYYFLMAGLATLGLIAKGIHASIKGILNAHKFFIRLDSKVDDLGYRLEKVEGYIFEGPNSSGNPGGSSNNREAGRLDSPFNGLGLWRKPSSGANGHGDRSGSLGGQLPGYSQGVVHLGIGEHAEGSRDE